MKKIIKILTIILLVITLSNCETQEQVNDTFEEDALNKWSLDQRGLSDDEDFVLTNCMKQSTLEFFEDDTFHQISYEENEEGECVETINTSGSWEYFVPAELRLTIDDETQKVTAHIGNIVLEGNEEKFVEASDGEFLRVHNIVDLDSGYRRIVSYYRSVNN